MSGLAPRATTGQSALVAILASVVVLPLHAQVCLLDSTWQDYPEWGTGAEHVAYTAPSLTNPQTPPFPGFAVATRPDFADGDSQDVAVLVQVGERPDLRLIHTSVLYVGGAGVEVGNAESGVTHLDLKRGDWPLESWVDAVDPAEVTRVVFVLTEPSG